MASAATVHPAIDLDQKRWQIDTRQALDDQLSQLIGTGKTLLGCQG
jgi:hypothetical protein